MSDNLAPPILRYFAWSHLPPHLRELSSSFADLAYLIAGLSEQRVFTDEAKACWTRIVEKLGPEPLHDTAAAAEWNTARHRMHAFRAAWLYMEDDLSHCLRLLLEAKDCAVRSRVPPPSGAACATGASEQQTHKPARPTRTVVVYGEKGSKFPSVMVLKETMDDPALRDLTLLDLEEPFLLEEFEADCWGHAQTYVQAKYHETLYRPSDPIVWKPWGTMRSQEEDDV